MEPPRPPPPQPAPTPATDVLGEALARWAVHHADGDCEPGADLDAAASALLQTAAELLESPNGGSLPPGRWHEYLDVTRRPTFLRCMPDRRARERWAETAFRAVRVSGYSLRTMLEQRARAHPDRTLFDDRREPDAPRWSYAEVERYARAIAGVFLDAEPEPRVAIFCENNVDGAVADLACLAAGIMVTPLNVHTDDDTLAWILERLDIRVAVTDTDARQSRLEQACVRSGRCIRIFRTGDRIATGASAGDTEAMGLRQVCTTVDLAAVGARLAGRTPDILAPATVMFTSGSTGQARGVVFSQYMLVTKRFARAAALPEVGEGEVLLCYLPLFHTFGRYLEMLGMLFWGGTYVFAGNPSADSFIADLGRVRPTGLISVPVRWTQIRERCLEAMTPRVPPSDGASAEPLRQIVGDRLRWGLSAAGYLDPQVFRFFQRHGVDLCSGFGMTEATGGITMTPPGEYEEGTVGIPLPGIDTRLGPDGELHISGVYVASYLDADGPPGTIVAPDPDLERWVPTGDLFHRRANGHYEIVDRIKDIYKNSRGQTVAPQRVERLFADVPGIRRVFLAGDHRDHNVLLIVPDADDPVLTARAAAEVREYYARIVASANSGLAPYERVVSFATLDRDFDADRGEVTPKGSLRRKVIETSFAPVIERLYRSKHVDLRVGALTARIPRWIFRDLGILEDDIIAADGTLVNRRTGATLPVVTGDDGRVRVGDLEYRVDGQLIDLGRFARQPRLWLGNAALVAFAPCKPGWDAATAGVSEQVRLPRGIAAETAATPPPRPVIDDDRLADVHGLAVAALFAPTEAARSAVERLGQELARADVRLGRAIRRRLEALAFREDERVRTIAYRTLLLDVPVIDYNNVFPAFIESGLSYLDEESIAIIAAARHGERRLQALRQRLYSYRTNMSWPGPPVRRRQLRRLFELLADYARQHPDDLAAVQAEFAAWALFRADPPLARTAQEHFDRLAKWHEQRLRDSRADVPETRAARAPGAVVYEFGIDPAERDQLERILSHPTYLRRSISHAFGDDGFGWDRVPPDGVWVSGMPSHRQMRLYRLGINLTDGRHFDLLLGVGDALRSRGIRDTILWLTALSDHAFGAPAVSPFGAWRQDLGAISMAYVSDLTGWERIRLLSSRNEGRDTRPDGNELRKLYVRAMATYFRAWEQSGYRIVPGAVTPSNVALPDADFHETASILSLAGWRPYEDPLSLVGPMLGTFYRLTAAHYPQLRDSLRVTWIFDACIEGVGQETAARFVDALEESLSLETEPVGQGARPVERGMLLPAVAQHRRELAAHEHVPLPVLCAIDRYREWERISPMASADAREETVRSMIEMYRLNRFPDAFRYHLYNRTYFARAGDEVDHAFARLVLRCMGDQRAFGGQLEELSALQALLRDPADRAVFSRMIFPHAGRSQRLEVMTTGGAEHRRVIVRSEIRDQAGATYLVREPLSAVEVGHLYRLILEAGYRMQVTEHARQLVVVDREERIVGGLSYRWEDAGVVVIDAIVVARSLTHQGLGGQLIEDFCVRMAARGGHLARTNFFLRALFTRHGFQVDERWGGLVRPLTSDPDAAIAPGP
jgi:long-chain acyl-CoA synthetase